MQGSYHYETVSGLVCEAFGYIPRTGESISVVFDKADNEDGPDRRDGDQDHHDDRREKYQRFNLEVRLVLASTLPMLIHLLSGNISHFFVM